METLVRLAWALPLVLTVGLAAMFALKRIVVRASPAPGRARRMTACESLTVSDETRLHLIEIDGKPHVLVESAARALLQTVHPPEAPPSRLAARWAQRLQEARSR